MDSQAVIICSSELSRTYNIWYIIIKNFIPYYLTSTSKFYAGKAAVFMIAIFAAY